MKKQININDLESLAIGATILGSGGGGNPQYDLQIAKYQMEKYGPIKLISFEDLNDEDLIIPVAFMGAPLIALEKISNGKEFLNIFKSIEKYFNKKATIIMPAEIGGANAFTPLSIAGILNMPVLDADLLGRAFPELQMSSANLMNISPSPAFLSNSQGNVVIIENGNSNIVEEIARNVTVSFGSSAALAMYLMNKNQVKKGTIKGSISKALELGNIILNAKNDNQDPIESIINKTNGKLIGSGIITDIDQEIKNGFLFGSVVICNDEQKIILNYQNENLIASINGKIVATTPDIIIPLDSENGTPITSESLTFGLRVSVISLPAPDLWKTISGLELVGPRYFGYEIDYKSINGV